MVDLSVYLTEGNHIAVNAELARRSLAEFVQQAWPIVEPSTDLIWNWHIDVVCERVQALMENRLGKRNLIINIPPGSLKSTILSVCLPAWMWIRTPSWRGLFASGNESIALRDSMKCRYILDSDWYKRLFRPEWKFAADQNAKGHYVNTAQGFRHAISAGSRITGDRADDMFVDDPNDAAAGKADRDAINAWWDDAAYNRLNDLNAGHRCIIQQRLHEEDLTGHILATDPEDWERLVIRQEFEPGDEQPWDPRTWEGDLFFPARFPAEVVAAEKRIKGSAGYAGQHQQRPTAKEGEIFRRGYVKTFRGVPKFTRTLLSADTAFKEKEESDYSVILAAGQCEEEGHAGIYLLDRWKDQAGYPVLKAKARTMGDRWHPEVFLIEDKASGQSLIQELTNDTLLPVRPVKADTDKVSRANACTPTWEASVIYVPEGAEWVDDFLENLYGFPKKAHDDDVDAFTQLVRYIVLGMTAQGFLGWLAGKEEACASCPTKPPFSIQL
jgi:predicted phage terminase large subunit-like protein